MARPEKDKHDRREPRSVSLRPADWAFLEGLAAEVGHRQDTRGTTSEAIRFLISEEKKRRGRLETHLDGHGNLDYQEAIFEVGVGEDGGRLIRRLNLQTGEVYHMTRTQEGPITVEKRTAKPKKGSAASPPGPR